MSRMKRRQCLALMVGLMACLITQSCTVSQITPVDGLSAPSVTLTVSAAASLQDALEAITPPFHQAHPEIAVNFNFGSSGALQRQIEQGAPADIFFSAATQQMDALEQQGLILSPTRRDLIGNTLVLIAPKDSSLAVDHMAQLQHLPIKRLAVGELRTVPAGQYAAQVFTALDVIQPLKSKLVFGHTVRGVLAAVEGGNADLGMVYATDAVVSERVKVLTTAPPASHSPIRYPITVLKASAHPQAARQFIDFLQGDKAQATFATFGFTPIASRDELRGDGDA